MEQASVKRILRTDIRLRSEFEVAKMAKSKVPDLMLYFDIIRGFDF